MQMIVNVVVGGNPPDTTKIVTLKSTIAALQILLEKELREQAEYEEALNLIFKPQGKPE